MKTVVSNAVYGLLKPANDAHTLGLQSAAQLLQECNQAVFVAEPEIQNALSYYREPAARKIIIDWLQQKKITQLGLSYRLDQHDAVNMLGYLYEEIKKHNLMSFQGGLIDNIFFSGLPASCKAIASEIKAPLICFQGGESAREFLTLMEVPPQLIPPYILSVSKYDESILQFGQEIIDKEKYLEEKSQVALNYPEAGSRQDSLLRRLAAAEKSAWHNQGLRPLLRAHVGPYSSGQDRLEAIRECADWGKQLAAAGLLDILSLGSSQLSQSNFGENWAGKLNGGGVPINSIADLEYIYQATRPLLLRTYAGTKNISALAEIYENSINICWHALSLWWFNKLDGRGPYDLYTNLREHIAAIRYIASTGKAFEANVSHHFSFRGGDDVSYIVTAYLAAKLAKKLGIKTFVLQNMLNTPRNIWGVQDLAKSRAMLRLIRSLEGKNFRVLLQPRAGLDFFKPDPYQAKIQLAAISCLMDDIEPFNQASPPLIHVVSYSEASHLATPAVINESLSISLAALKAYREARQKHLIDDMSKNTEALKREQDLFHDAKLMIDSLEQAFPDLYSAEGLYKAFTAGFFPLPYLWDDSSQYSKAKAGRTRIVSGAAVIVDEKEQIMPMKEHLARAAKNISTAEYYLQQHNLA